jgi:UPF0271 protein
MSSEPAVDLNADLGESYGPWRLGDDEALLSVVTSANVACGFHAGHPRTIEQTVVAAVGRGVVVGAHVSYPDLVGFGRRSMEVAPDGLAADVIYQIGAVEAFCRVVGTSVRYVKPHGALYNRVVVDAVQASGVVAAVRRYDATLPLLTLPGGELARAAESAGVPWVGEGFADRAYTPDGRAGAADGAGGGAARAGGGGRAGGAPGPRRRAVHLRARGHPRRGRAGPRRAGGAGHRWPDGSPVHVTEFADPGPTRRGDPR